MIAATTDPRDTTIVVDGLSIEKQFARIRAGRRHLQWFAGSILWSDGYYLHVWGNFVPPGVR